MKNSTIPHRLKGQTKNGRSRASGSVASKASLPAVPAKRRRTAKGPVGRSTVISGHAGSKPVRTFPIVGLGASAGGLDAFTQVLKHLPVDTGMAFVLVQHLDPTHESALPEILSRATAMRVQEVTDDLSVEPNQVYVIPPNTCMEINEGTLRLTPRKESRGAQRSIDSFFESLARDRAGSSIGVVLSGTASDGTLGLEAIKAEGGITFAQDHSAKFDSMPRNAIAAGCVDFILSPPSIAAELTRIAKHPLVTPGAGEILRSDRDAKQVPDRLESNASIPALDAAKSKTPRTKTQDDQARAPSAQEVGFAKILLLLRNHCGVDFSPYKPSTIHRRISRRMVLNRQSTLDEYASLAKGNTKELEALYSDVLIGVTSFFRNAEAFEVLKQKVLRPLLATRKREGLVRVWTLGCSTGQEAYSIAMAFAEVAEKVTGAPKLQIFATDLNEAMLEKARRGLYAKTLVQDLSPERLRRFFVEEDGGYRVSKALREQVVFARQNVMGDPPFSRIDLVSCRNLLIYFETDLQKRIMPAFHYALMPGGFLFLGASESIGPFTELFTPVDKKQKIFAKNPAPTPAFRLALSQNRGTPPLTSQRAKVREKLPGVPEGLRGEYDAQREADRLSSRLFAPPGVLVNADLQVLQFRGVTWAYLQPPVGRASFNVLKMAHEGLMLPLRAAINKAKREKKTVRRENVHVRHDDSIRVVHLQVIPLKNVKEHCYLILFEDAKKALASGQAAVRAGRESKLALPNRGSKKAATRVAELERELAETREYLQSIQEQHDASAEELQASSEEGQSANEELQSINEELETSKEELESTNEELTTVNEEMTNRNGELNGLNNDLNNLHISINTAILVLGRDLTIRRFTVQAGKIFNLLPGDIGRPISGIRHNLECRDLEAFVRDMIDTGSIREREVQDKEGHWYSLRARPYVTLDNKIDGAVLVLVDIAALKDSEQTIRESRDYADAILREVPPLLILDKDLRIERANDSFYKCFKVAPSETDHRLIYDLGNGQWQIPKLRTLLEDILPRHSFFNDFEIVHEFVGLGRRTMLLHARQLDSVQRIVLRLEDVTERLESRAAVTRSEIRYRRLFEAGQDGVLIIDPSSRKITDANPFISHLLGYKRDELIGKELWEIGLIENEEASHSAFAELKTKGFIRYEDLPLKTKSGQKREVEFVSNLYEEAGTNTIQCNIRDITERLRSEQALRESEKRLAAILEQLPVGVSLVDLDGHVILNNLVMRRFIPATIPSKDEQRIHRWRALASDGLPLAPSRWPGGRALRGETVVPGIDFLFEEDDGRRSWTSVSASPLRDSAGAITGAVVMVQDINERKVAEAAMNESRQQASRILGSITDSFFVIDADWRLTDMNAAARRNFTARGMDAPALLGKQFWTEAFPDTRGTQVEVEYRRAMQDRVSLEFDYFYPVWESWYAIRVYPIEDGGITIYFHDVTDRKRADAALAKSVEDLQMTKAALEASSRAKDEFLAALSHELRTPLTPALLTATALREDERLPAEVREQLAMVERNIALEARLIDDMLDLTAVSRGKLLLRAQLCDAHTLIGLAIEIVRQDAQDKGISIECVFTAQHSGILADPARFQQVIWNLLRNAVKFTPTGGKIAIHTREEKTTSRERWLRIEVSDTGVGIEPALLDRIFLPFDQGSLTGNHRFGGIGLGLAIARAVVDLHGGRISAQSDGANQGSRFVVELPGAVDPATGDEGTATPFLGGLGSSAVSPRLNAVAVPPLRLLLVEDHVSSLQTLALFLRRDGHHVVTAATVAAARSAAEKEQFDLVVSDLGLPDGTGTDLMETLRDSYGLRGIALSGYGMTADLVRSRAAGFAKHLVKPVSISDLRKALSELTHA